MTREERINSALLPILEKMREHRATDEMCKMYDNGFHVGAMWADAHPDIDVRTMAAWRGGYKEAIEKACEWLHTALYLDHEHSIEHRYATLEELLNDFIRKAMKGCEG